MSRRPGAHTHPEVSGWQPWLSQSYAEVIFVHGIPSTRAVLTRTGVELVLVRIVAVEHSAERVEEGCQLLRGVMDTDADSHRTRHVRSNVRDDLLLEFSGAF